MKSLQQGDIRGAAIDFLVSQHVEQHGYSDVSCEFRDYSSPTGKYLLIKTSAANITISHLRHSNIFPRHADFRTQARQLNHPELFADDEAHRRSITDRVYLLLTYGDQNLEFMQIGLLHPEKNRWMESPMDLLMRPHESQVDDREGLDVSIDLELKIPTTLPNEFLKHIANGR